MCSKVLSCSVMSDSLGPHDLPGSSVHGILQARVLEWVAISFSRGSSRPRDRARVSCVSVLAGGLFTTCHLGSPYVLTDDYTLLEAEHWPPPNPGTGECVVRWQRGIRTTGGIKPANQLFLSWGDDPGVPRWVQWSPGAFRTRRRAAEKVRVRPPKKDSNLFSSELDERPINQWPPYVRG